jgi:transposase-like protein
VKTSFASTRRITEITEVLCGLAISSTQVLRFSKILDEQLDKFRTRVATSFPNSASCLRLVSAILIEIHEDRLQLEMPYVHMAQIQRSMLADDDTLMIYTKKVA